jgi:hypothetical protein
VARGAGAVLASVLAVGGCQSATGPEEYRPEDYAPSKTVIQEGSFRLEPLASTRIDIRAPETDPRPYVPLFATIDWTNPSNNVVAAFAGEDCAGVNAALRGSCQARGGSPSRCLAKPRVLTVEVVPGGVVSLYVANAGGTVESGRVQIVLCQEAPACVQCDSEGWAVTSCHPQ